MASDDKEGKKPPYSVNAEVKSDLFVIALKDIAKGEEIFIMYNLTNDYENNEEDGE